MATCTVSMGTLGFQRELMLRCLPNVFLRVASIYSLMVQTGFAYVNQTGRATRARCHRVRLRPRGLRTPPLQPLLAATPGSPGSPSPHRVTVPNSPSLIAVDPTTGTSGPPQTREPHGLAEETASIGIPSPHRATVPNSPPLFTTATSGGQSRIATRPRLPPTAASGRARVHWRLDPRASRRATAGTRCQGRARVARVL